ncbi:hypothetical protein [Thermoanaerobacterium sp. RBIITD]|uniref:hypothetical protein n=1 Tax=Thermoanaerobacterium sp. RBIITD TaxID=1550240 RepID=UPI000BB98A59|nr:hypothetical protein [Thermoanaerobacterium sp. RBIITD]SNX53230.1 hypothetical protein SAMN05660242_0732 [Thermoanaerobacterium sp. RBIITD]
MALLSVSRFSYVFAADTSDNNTKIIVNISDPETGYVWKWKIPESEVKLTTSKINNSKISAFRSDAPPYSILDCRVYVYGMKAYRYVSVKFDLTNP